jgi:hypothetical protein
VKGIIDHHVLNLHHVVERLGVSVWDWVFLASGVVLVVIGGLLLAGDRGGAGGPHRRGGTVALASGRPADHPSWP